MSNTQQSAGRGRLQRVGRGRGVGGAGRVGWRLCGLFFGLMSLGGCQLLDMARFTYTNATSEHAWAGSEHITSVPFELVNNHIIVPVSINGSEPLNFVLDSAAAATVVVYSRRSRELRLPSAGEVRVSGSGSGQQPTANIVKDAQVSVGSVSLLAQSLISLPLDALPFFEELDEVYFDGVIGYDFLRRFVVEVNYDQMRVVLAETDNYQSPFQGRAAPWQTLPLSVDGAMPYLNAQVRQRAGEAQAVKLLVDTGSTSSFSLVASSIGGLDLPQTYFVETAQGLAGDISQRVTQFDSLALGEYRLGAIPGRYSVAGERGDSNSNGILGNRVLSRVNHIFDYANRTQAVQPNHSIEQPMRADPSGLRKQPQARGAVVKNVAAGTAGAAAGLRVGDIITLMDQRPVTAQSVNELHRALSSPADTVNLCWESGGQQRCAQLKLATRYQRFAGA